jgi:hypothetical protein
VPRACVTLRGTRTRRLTRWGYLARHWSPTRAWREPAPSNRSSVALHVPLDRVCDVAACYTGAVRPGMDSVGQPHPVPTPAACSSADVNEAFCSGAGRARALRRLRFARDAAGWPRRRTPATGLPSKYARPAAHADIRSLPGNTLRPSRATGATPATRLGEEIARGYPLPKTASDYGFPARPNDQRCTLVAVLCPPDNSATLLYYFRWTAATAHRSGGHGHSG